MIIKKKKSFFSSYVQEISYVSRKSDILLLLLRSFSIYCLNCTLSKPTRNIIVQTRIHSNNLCECVFVTQKNNELCKKKNRERVREVQHKERCEFKTMKKKNTPSKRRRSSKKISKCALNMISRLFRMGLDYFGTRRIENIFFSIVRFFFTHCSLLIAF